MCPIPQAGPLRPSPRTIPAVMSSRACTSAAGIRAASMSGRGPRSQAWGGDGSRMPGKVTPEVEGPAWPARASPISCEGRRRVVRWVLEGRRPCCGDGSMRRATTWRCVGRLPDGAEIRGMAVFWDEGVPSALRYRVTCDAEWQRPARRVDGWRGGRPVELRIRRLADGSWRLNGRACPRGRRLHRPGPELHPGHESPAAAPARAGPRRGGRGAVGVARHGPGPCSRRCPSDTLRRSADFYAYEADVPGDGRFAGRPARRCRGLGAGLRRPVAARKPHG